MKRWESESRISQGRIESPWLAERKEVKQEMKHGVPKFPHISERQVSGIQGWRESKEKVHLNNSSADYKTGSEPI